MSAKKKKSKVIPIRDFENKQDRNDVESSGTEGNAEEGTLSGSQDPSKISGRDTIEIETEESVNSAVDETNEQVGESDKVDDLEARLAKMTENWQRERASFINFKKRVEEEKSSIRKFASFDLVFDLLRVIDYFESSVSFGENIPEEARDVIIGVEYTLKELKQILSAHGVSPIEVKGGDRFDSSFMEAVERRELEDMPADRVLDVQRSGWRLHDRILRSTQVVVSAAVDKQNEADSESERGDKDTE